jgi:hypothetical protein
MIIPEDPEARFIGERNTELFKAEGYVRQLIFGKRLNVPPSALATSGSEEVKRLHDQVAGLYENLEIDNEQGVYLFNTSQQSFHVRRSPFIITSYDRTSPKFRKRPFGTWQHADSLTHLDGQQPQLVRTLHPVRTYGLEKKDNKVGTTQATIEEVRLVNQMIWLNRKYLRNSGDTPTISAAPRETSN